MASSDQLLKVDDTTPASKDPERGMQPLSVIDPAAEESPPSCVQRAQTFWAGFTKKQKVYVATSSTIVVVITMLCIAYHRMTAKPPCPDGFLVAPSSGGRRLMRSNEPNCVPIVAGTTGSLQQVNLDGDQEGLSPSSDNQSPLRPQPPVEQGSATEQAAGPDHILVSLFGHRLPHSELGIATGQANRPATRPPVTYRVTIIPPNDAQRERQRLARQAHNVEQAPRPIFASPLQTEDNSAKMHNWQSDERNGNQVGQFRSYVHDEQWQVFSQAQAENYELVGSPGAEFQAPDLQGDLNDDNNAQLRKAMLQVHVGNNLANHQPSLVSNAENLNPPTDANLNSLNGVVNQQVSLDAPIISRLEVRRNAMQQVDVGHYSVTDPSHTVFHVGNGNLNSPTNFYSNSHSDLINLNSPTDVVSKEDSREEQKNDH